MTDAQLAIRENWPPGSSPQVPLGLREEIASVRNHLHELEERLSAAEEKARAARIRAWRAYHEVHGWPNDPEYQQRLGRVE